MLEHQVKRFCQYSSLYGKTIKVEVMTDRCALSLTRLREPVGSAGGSKGSASAAGPLPVLVLGGSEAQDPFFLGRAVLKKTECAVQWRLKKHGVLVPPLCGTSV